MRLRSLLVPAAVLAVGACDRFSAITVPAGDEGGDPGITRAATVILTPIAAELTVGSSIRFSAVVRDVRGYELSGAAITWTSSNAGVATIDEHGVAKGLSPGSTTITAKSDSATGAAPLTVRAASSTDLEWTLVLVGQGLAALNAVWGSSGTDVFAVGTTQLWDCCATVIHYDGSAWSHMSIPEDDELNDVWGSSGTDVFAVGNGILHYDGKSWSPMPSAPRHNFYGVWGSSATDVFAVGGIDAATISHYDGQSWSDIHSPIPVPWLEDVWGSSSSDVFAVGQRGTILHYDGRSWSTMVSPTGAQLNAVWGSSGHDVYAVGLNGTVVHYDGQTWSNVAGGLTDQELLEVWGSSDTDVYAVGSKNWYPNCCAVLLHFDGRSWSASDLPTGHALWGLWGSSRDDVFLVGSGATILHGTRNRSAK